MTASPQPTPALDSQQWSITLHGRSVASYAFPPCTTPPEPARWGATFVRMDDLAAPLMWHSTEPHRPVDQQGTSGTSAFLTVVYPRAARLPSVNAAWAPPIPGGSF